jgi:hypothetical protein
MKILFIILGAILTLSSLYYFYGLIELLSISYEFTGYGYGILAGRSFLLILGIVLLYLGFRRKPKKAKSL